MAHDPHAAHTVEITCEDGTRLSGHFLPAHAGAQAATEKPVLLCPATGVRQHFYFNFARWLGDQGHDVLVFDYRGVGLSLSGPLKECRATLSEWGQQDQVAALDWLVQRTGSQQVLLLGHSAGGQMLGLLPNHQHVVRAVGVGSSTGWFSHMRPTFRARAVVGLRVILPLGIRLRGYAPSSLIGLGENLPAKVALQWGDWCSKGGYATNAVRHAPERDFHHHIRIPYTVLHATDDDIATPGTVADLMRTFPSAQKQVHHIAPSDHGLKAIGHLDWFRASHQVLWPLLREALHGHRH